jgi:SpoVK/Ycf46/Vps4 family AAA+-type ATPase
MDGLGTRNSKMFFITTNEDISCIEEAFLRPGRIDRTFYFGNPINETREKYYNELVSDSVKEKISKNDFVNKTENFSYAEIKLFYDTIFEKVLLNKELDIDKIHSNILINKEQRTQNKKMGFK